MRKKYRLLLVGVVVLLALLACSGCCSHEYIAATCIEPQKCRACKETVGSALGHDFKPATYDFPAQCTRCGDIRGEKLTPPSEWGFNHLAQMGNAIVEITGYNLSDPNNSYVSIHAYKGNGSVMQFKNGYNFAWNFTIQNSKCIFGLTEAGGRYEIADNNNISIDSGWRSIRIVERVTDVTGKKYVIFIASKSGYDKYYIPYSLIDWDRGAFYDGSENDYILYLVS